jgi:Tfp pilus tip-associated adhesin PilY1
VRADKQHSPTLSGGLVNNWTGKRLFAARPSQANPPPAGEYYPAQAIYAPANAAYDESNNLWVYFGTGDRNHPNNTSSKKRKRYLVFFGKGLAITAQAVKTMLSPSVTSISSSWTSRRCSRTERETITPSSP